MIGRLETFSRKEEDGPRLCKLLLRAADPKPSIDRADLLGGEPVVPRPRHDVQGSELRPQRTVGVRRGTPSVEAGGQRVRTKVDVKKDGN